MKLAISTVLLVSLAALPVFAQDQEKEKEKDKPAQQEEKKEPERKQEPKQEEKNRAEQEKQQDKQQQKQNDEHARQAEQRQEQKQQQKDAAKQQQQPDKERAQQARRDDHNAQQAPRDGGARNARRIKEEDFHAHFGRPHVFHVERRDDHRFNYSGYWFQYTEAWPADWAYSDDVYVDEIDGEYYLIDPLHPGFRLLVIVVE